MPQEGDLFLDRDALLAGLHDNPQNRAFWGDVARGVGDEVTGDAGQPPDTPLDIIGYLTSTMGLGVTPYPIQRFCLKMFHGLPLDDTVRDIQTWDEFREHVTGEYTEREFLRFLHECPEQRCNISPEEYDTHLNRHWTTIVMRLGRRGTKTSMCQWEVNYQLYRLSHLRNPQRHYGLLQVQPISMVLMSVSEEKAQKLLAPAIESVRRSVHLSKYIESVNKGNLALRLGDSRDDTNRFSKIEVMAYPCSASATRGDANILVILEEYGFFFKKLAESNKSDVQVWTALEPSRNGFENPETGHPEGTVFIVSSPGTEEAHMKKIEDDIRAGKIADGLVLVIPSYWVNPKLSSLFLHNLHNTDPASFRCEYGAEYVKGVSTAFSQDHIESCWEPPHAGYGTVRTGEACYMGIDLGGIAPRIEQTVESGETTTRLRYDGSAIAIVAANPDGKARLTCLEYLLPEMPQYGRRLTLHEIGQRIDELWNYFGCVKGYADFWELAGLMLVLTSAARDNLEQIHTSEVENDRVARHFITTLEGQWMTMYASDADWENPYSFANELLALQRITSGGLPPKVKLRARAGGHDDQYSAVSRALWMARSSLADNPVNIVTTAQERQYAAQLRYASVAAQRVPVYNNVRQVPGRGGLRRGW